MPKSETPTKDGLPAPYKFDPNAPIRTPREGNFSTADHTLRENRRIAHVEALTSEAKHYDTIHSTHRHVTKPLTETPTIPESTFSNRETLRTQIAGILHRRNSSRVRR